MPFFAGGIQINLHYGTSPPTNVSATPDVQVQKRVFSLPVVYTKPRLYICQDRLGTNIGNVEKGDALPQDITIRDLDVHAVRSSYAITRYASTAIA